MIIDNILIFFILLLAGSFYSGVEIGYVTVARTQILYRYIDKNPLSKNLYFFSKNPHIFFSTILVGNNLVNIALPTLLAGLLKDAGVIRFEFFAPLILMPFIFIFWESLPKLIYRKYNDLFFKTSWALLLSYIIMFPIIHLFGAISKMMYGLIGIKSPPVLETEEMRIATNETLKSFFGNKFSNYNESLFLRLKFPLRDLIKYNDVAMISNKMNTKEAALLITRSGLSCGIVKKENTLFTCHVNSLFFSSTVLESAETPFIVQHDDNTAAAITEFFDSEKNFFLIMKNDKIYNLSTKEELSRLLLCGDDV